MKIYQVSILILLLHSLQTDAFWPKWIDNFATKFNGITDVILHKEFTHANQLELHNQNGAIVINSWKQNSIAIEVIISCTENCHKEVKVDMECIDGIIKIHTNFVDEKLKASVLFNILLPQNINITITTKQGNIIIKDIDSNLDLQTLQGDIKLANPHKNVIATTTSGNITIRTDSIEEDKIFSLISNKGNIQVYTTSIINSSIDAQALQGKITSDIPITLDSQTTLLNTEAWKNFRQIVRGSIGKPISKLTMIADNGSIAIMPYTKQSDIF